jgi:hypothetical protein
MGKPMRAEYQQARAWMNDVITFDRDFQADTFTLSMTFLGSLLALHDLTGDGMYLKKALDLADRCDGLFKPLQLIVVGLQQSSACCGSSRAFGPAKLAYSSFWAKVAHCYICFVLHDALARATQFEYHLLMVAAACHAEAAFCCMRDCAGRRLHMMLPRLAGHGATSTCAQARVQRHIFHCTAAVSAAYSKYQSQAQHSATQRCHPPAYSSIGRCHSVTADCFSSC